MKARLLHIFVVCLGWFLYSTALPRSKDYRTLSSEYVPGEGNSNEPTCEVLRAMWRFSKRQSRAAEITNEIPTYRDPFAHNVWEEYARPRSAGRGRYRKPPIYGRVIHSANSLRPIEDSPERIRAFEEVARLFGTQIPIHPYLSGLPRHRPKTSFRFGGGGGGPSYQAIPAPQTGSFQHLKDLIKGERIKDITDHRMSEEAEPQRGRIYYSPIQEQQPIPSQSMSINEKAPGQGSRGVVAFPDILIPSSSKYMDEYIPSGSQPASNAYKHRYPRFNSIS